MARVRGILFALALLAVAAPAGAEEIIGVLRSVSGDGGSFVIQKMRGDEEIRFRGGIGASIDGIIQTLPEGARVRVIFDQVGNELVVIGLKPL
ncbi:MAG: hypothetical protein EXQ96_04905 [Alphaproteobacteria bacterium]|nr:hypothetical protein [Alphaproteobacteria bacterium]